MRCAAMVRIQNSPTKLKLWLSYYSRYFDDLYLLECSTPPGAFDHLKKKYKFDEIRVDGHIHSASAHEAVFAKQKELLKDHDWVLYSDLDEFVVADPKKYRGLRDFMRRSKEKQTFCYGYDVIQKVDEGPIDYTKPYLMQRTTWVYDPSGSYNKPALSRIPTDWVEGFHQVREMSADEVKGLKNTGLYMIHLKWADINFQEDFAIGGSSRSGEFEEKIPTKVRRVF